MSEALEPQLPASIPVDELFAVMEEMLDQQHQNLTEFRESQPSTDAEQVVTARFEGATLAFSALQRLVKLRYPEAFNE